MDFKDDISAFTAAQIMAALGCPRGTAYDWLDGRREPPKWQRPHWLKILNDTALPQTPPQRRGPKPQEK
jgi:hypothetical protein